MSNHNETGESRVTLVNQLLNESFEKVGSHIECIEGNSYPTFNLPDLHRGEYRLCGSMPNSESLNLVTLQKRTCFRFVGRFDKGGDGTNLVVFPEYEQGARKYAQLFEERVGAKVNLIVDELAVTGPIAQERRYFYSSESKVTQN